MCCKQTERSVFEYRQSLQNIKYLKLPLQNTYTCFECEFFLKVDTAYILKHKYYKLNYFVY